MPNKIFGNAEKVRCPMPNEDSSVTIKEAILAQLRLMREQNLGKHVKILSVVVGKKELKQLEFSFGDKTVFLSYIENFLDREEMEITFVLPLPTT